MDIIKLYKIIALGGLIFIIYEIIFVKRKKKNTTYAIYPFCFSSIYWVFFTGCLAVIDFSDRDGELYGLTFRYILDTYSFLLFIFLIQVCFTVMLFLFLGKYSEYHIVYNPKKKRKPLTINLEESYIVLYGLLKVKKEKIYVRDIVIEDSVYVMEFSESKFFPILAVIGSKEYMVAKLTNGKTIKINCSPFFIHDEGFTLLSLAKTMKIKIVHNPKQIKETK